MSDKKTATKVCELEYTELTTPKIVEYEILHGSIKRILVDRVNEMLAKGWEPFGNLVVDSDVIIQAMVKYSD